MKNVENVTSNVKTRRPFNKKNDDVKPAAKAEEAKAAE